jgi:DNA-binding GntR family transcriptional regulator
LRQDIILGYLPPASKLKLQALSRSYNVCVGTMRESLSRLSAEGLVAAEGQKGFAVQPVSVDDLREITEMRQLLECHGLRLSIANADLDWEARVIAAYHKLSRAEAVVEEDPAQHGAGWERFNQEFHEALISNCRSRWLLLYRQAIYGHSLRYRILSLKTKSFRPSQSAKEHQEILDAALKRDAEVAERVLAQHIMNGAELSPRATEM